MTITGQGTRGRTVGLWWLALIAVAMAAFAPRQYLTGSLHDLGAGGDVFAANYAAQPEWVQGALYVHIACAAIALALSPLQFARRVRARLPRLHRTVGRIVLGCVLLGGGAGLVLAPSNMAGAVGTAGFGLLAILWITCAVAGLRAILRGDVTAHRRWMVRTFALTYAGVMLRLWLPALVPLMGGDLLAAYRFVPFLCWVPNLVVAELVLRRRPVAVPA